LFFLNVVAFKAETRMNVNVLLRAVFCSKNRRLKNENEGRHRLL